MLAVCWAIPVPVHPARSAALEAARAANQQLTGPAVPAAQVTPRGMPPTVLERCLCSRLRAVEGRQGNMMGGVRAV